MVWATPSWVKLDAKQREARRLAAARDLEAGMTQAEVARKYEVSTGTANLWDQRRRDEGMDGLKARTATGRPPRLSPSQQEELVALLALGAREHGFRTDAWNGRRVHSVIEQRFGVVYNVDYIPRLLRSLGFRLRRPDRQAIEKDEAAKQEWLESTWEHCKKNSSPAGRSSSSTKQATR